ncbi:MAG: DUF4340 domain-containing protein [Planctomycetaceae bacterium]
MNETTRTLIFCGVAVAAVAGAIITQRKFEPAPLEGYNDVGQEFYKDFTDPTAAKGMRIAVYNPENAEIKLFDVENKNGIWTIPSRHNYPADGADRLAKTAASVIGITRGALESRRKTDHERLGVLDPMDVASTALKGRGQRLTIKGESDTVLADYIIGNPIEGKSDEYFVRRPDEDAVYRTKLAINLSAKFSDWIEADLLKLERDTLKNINIRKYSIDEEAMKLVGLDVNELVCEKPGDPWKLQGLDETVEQLNTEAVNTLVNLLDNLKIVGVRPKPAGLSKNLKLSDDLNIDPISRLDLQSKGFIVARDQNDKQTFVANEGEMVAATNQGVVYHLFFGEVFTGSELEIELGTTPDKSKPADDKAGPPENEDPLKDAKQDAQNRYLFVTVDFDEQLIGPEPQKPTKPEKPSAETPTEKPKEEAKTEEEPKADSPDEAIPAEKPSEESSEEPKSDAATDETPAKSDAAASESTETGTEPEKPETPADAPSEDAPAETTAETKPADEPKPAPSDPEADYQAALQAYEADLAKYKSDVASRDEKIKKGKDLVKDLNDRFADWYYVISGSSFEQLQLNRTSFVKPKETPPENGANDQNGDASPPAGEQPGSPPSENETPEEKTPEPGTDDQPKSETEGTPEEPTTESKTDESATPEPANEM